MDRQGLLGVDRAALVDRLAEHVHDAAERLRADRHRDRAAGVDHLHAADQAVGGAHRDRADFRLAELLRHLEHQLAAVGADVQRVQDVRQLALEANVDDCTRDLDVRGREFDVASVIFNRFKSAMTQIVTRQQLIPPPAPEADATAAPATLGGAVYEFEPDEAEILADLLPRNLTVQIFRVLLENAASFYGSQMTAMDSASRNAGDVIKKLTLQMNRSRQASITKELIEIISGAEAI